MSNKTEIRKAVREKYVKLANSAGKFSCCGGTNVTFYETMDKEAMRKAIGYGEETATLPPEVSNMSAGCGNPIAIANLKPGEVVLDLGSGGGIDVFIAAKKVGNRGKVIGVDATPEMIWRARESAKKAGHKNVEFRLGEIEHLPVESNTIDVAISNCVINLSPEKEKVFKEVFRVLKPNGRLMFSDIVSTGKLPAEVRRDLENWVGCIAGAVSQEEYIKSMEKAGFKDVKCESKHVFTYEEIKGMLASCLSKTEEELAKKYSSKIASANFIAVKH